MAQKHNATVGGDMEERIQGLRKRGAEASQHLIAPKNWSGSECVNIFQVLCDLLDLVREMNMQLLGPTPTPGNGAIFVKNAGSVSRSRLYLSQLRSRAWYFLV